MISDASPVLRPSIWAAAVGAFARFTTPAVVCAEMFVTMRSSGSAGPPTPVSATKLAVPAVMSVTVSSLSVIVPPLVRFTVSSSPSMVVMTMPPPALTVMSPSAVSTS